MLLRSNNSPCDATAVRVCHRFTVYMDLTPAPPRFPWTVASRYERRPVRAYACRSATASTRERPSPPVAYLFERGDRSRPTPCSSRRWLPSTRCANARGRPMCTRDLDWNAVGPRAPARTLRGWGRDCEHSPHAAYLLPSYWDVTDTQQSRRAVPLDNPFVRDLTRHRLAPFAAIHLDDLVTSCDIIQVDTTSEDAGALRQQITSPPGEPSC